MTATEEKNTTGNSGGSGAEANPTPSPSWRGFRRFVRGRFDLSEDKASESEVIENIRKGIEFKGTNLWVLVFATFIASLGLNVNSTAVIIGAMLISPLMGPIMGIGLSVGINDFELMKRSLRNFGFMVLVSIATSTFYFVISPLSNAQSELLARTVPTTYDVLIALFGGLAGIVAQSRKDRTSTVIPGVAIATALMPPLCTAGFGLATLQFKYFIGAFYLFFINTVFIAIATYMVVRFLKYEKHSFLDSKKERKVRRSMVLIVLVTLIPSVVIGYRIVKRSVFEANADRYVATVMKFPQAQVVEPGYKYNMPDMQAALALGQLARIEEINARRTELALRYRELLSGIDEILPLSDPSYDFKHAWHLFVVRVVKGKLNRDEFMAALKEKNIGTGLHFRCVHLQKYYREQMGCRPGMLPNTEWNSDRICSIPLFPSMTEKDQDDVVAAIKEVLA